VIMRCCLYYPKDYYFLQKFQPLNLILSLLNPGNTCTSCISVSKLLKFFRRIFVVICVCVFRKPGLFRTHDLPWFYRRNILLNSSPIDGKVHHCKTTVSILQLRQLSDPHILLSTLFSYTLKLIIRYQVLT
jgi:hypothetical protein